MDGFSDLGGPLGYGDSTREKKWNSLHAQRGIGKGKGSRIIHIWFILKIFEPFNIGLLKNLEGL